MGRKPLDAPRTGTVRRPSRMAPGGRMWAESPASGLGTRGGGENSIVLDPPLPGEIVWSGYVDPTPRDVEGGYLTEDWGDVTESAWVAMWIDGADLVASDTGTATDLVYLPTRALFASDSAGATDARRSLPTQGADTAVAVDMVTARALNVSENLLAHETGMPRGLLSQIAVTSLPSMADASVITGTVVDESGSGNSGAAIGSLLYRTGVTPNGSPAMWSNTSGTGYLQFPNTMWNGKTAAHLFVYVNVPTAYPGSYNYGPWWMGTVPGNTVRMEYPYTYYSSQYVYDSSFRTYMSGGNVSVTPPNSLLNTWHIYETAVGPQSGSVSSFSRLDGGAKATSYYWFTSPTGPYYLLRGGPGLGKFYVAEFLAFDRVLTDMEAEWVRGYLHTKYGAVGPSTREIGTAVDAVSTILYPSITSADTATAVDAPYLPFRVIFLSDTAQAVDAPVLPGVLYAGDSAHAVDLAGSESKAVWGTEVATALDSPQEFLRAVVADTASSTDLMRQIDTDLTNLYDFDGANSGEGQAMVPTLTGTDAGTGAEGYVDAVIDVVSFSDGVFPASVTVSPHVTIIPATAPSGGTPPSGWVVRLDGFHEDSSTRTLTLSLTGHATPVTRVRFWHSTSSENIYDRGQALFPGQSPFVQISGITRWAQYLSPALPGSAITWRYVKDGGLFGGQDSYYLGYIEILGHVDVGQRRTDGDLAAGTAENSSIQEDSYLLGESASAVDAAADLTVTDLVSGDTGSGTEGYVEYTYRLIDFANGIPPDLIPDPGCTMGTGWPNNVSLQTYPLSGFNGTINPAPARFLRLGTDYSGYRNDGIDNTYGFSIPLTQPTLAVRFWQGMNSYGSSYQWAARHTPYANWEAQITVAVGTGDLSWQWAAAMCIPDATVYRWETTRGSFVSQMANEGYGIARIEFQAVIEVTQERVAADSAVAADEYQPLTDPDLATSTEDTAEFSMTSGDDWLRAPDIAGDLDRDSVPEAAQAHDGKEVLVADGMTYLWAVDSALATERAPLWTLADEDTLTDAVSERRVTSTDAGTTMDAVESRVSDTPYDFENVTVVEEATVTSLEHFAFDVGQVSEGYGPEMGASAVLIDLSAGMPGVFTASDGYITVENYGTPGGGEIVPDPPAKMIKFFGNSTRYADRVLTLNANPWRATQIRFWHSMATYPYVHYIYGYVDGGTTNLFGEPGGAGYPYPPFTWRERTETLLASPRTFVWRYYKGTTTTTLPDSYYVAKIELLGCPPIPVTVVNDADSATAADLVIPNEYPVSGDTATHADGVTARSVFRTDTAAATAENAALVQHRDGAETAVGIDSLSAYASTSRDTASTSDAITEAYAPTAVVGMAVDTVTERSSTSREAASAAESSSLTSPDLNYTETYAPTYGTGFAPTVPETASAAETATDRTMTAEDVGTSLDEPGAYDWDVAVSSDVSVLIGITGFSDAGTSTEAVPEIFRSLTDTGTGTDITTVRTAVLSDLDSGAGADLPGAPNLLALPDTASGADVVAEDRDLAKGDSTAFPYQTRITAAYGATARVVEEAVVWSKEAVGSDTGEGSEDTLGKDSVEADLSQGVEDISTAESMGTDAAETVDDATKEEL